MYRSRVVRRVWSAILIAFGAVAIIYGVAYGTLCTTISAQGECGYDLLWLGLLLLGLGGTSVFFGVRGLGRA
jgi:hypothetical protein